MGLQAALPHHISSLRQVINIISDAEFQLANDALDARLKHMKKTGESKPGKHKAVISDADERLSFYFSNLSSPVVLTEAVWFAITYHFTLRGCENEEQLRKQDLVKKERKRNRVFRACHFFQHQEPPGRDRRTRKGEQWVHSAAEASCCREAAPFEATSKERPTVSDGTERTKAGLSIALFQWFSPGQEHACPDDEAHLGQGKALDCLHKSLCARYSNPAVGRCWSSGHRDHRHDGAQASTITCALRHEELRHEEIRDGCYSRYAANSKNHTQAGKATSFDCTSLLCRLSPRRRFVRRRG